MKRTMKALLVLLVCGLSFAACKKEKDDAPSIVGKWGIYQSTWKYSVNGQVQDQGTDTYTATHEDYFTLEIKSDGNFIETYNDGNTDGGTYRIEENKIYITYTGEPEVSGDFNISGNELSVTYKDQGTINGISYSSEGTSKYKKL